jgi:hypothetical protein
MTSQQLREQLDAALASVDGDTAPVRKLVFDLHSALKTATARQQQCLQEVATCRADVARVHDQLAHEQSAQAALRQRYAQALADQAALERELAEQRKPPASIICGEVYCRSNGRTYRLQSDAAAKRLLELGRQGTKVEMRYLSYEADSPAGVQELQRYWDALGLDMAEPRRKEEDEEGHEAGA